MKCYEISRNDSGRNLAKFRLNPFREISRNFAKFREIGKNFRLVSCFAKRGKPNFVAALSRVLLFQESRDLGMKVLTGQ
jgi:hypothetical protein